MKVEVNAERCSGSGLCSGLCADICPEVFEIEVDVAAAKFAEVPARYEAACREAADQCPTGAIAVEEQTRPSVAHC